MRARASLSLPPAACTIAIMLSSNPARFAQTLGRVIDNHFSARSGILESVAVFSEQLWSSPVRQMIGQYLETESHLSFRVLSNKS